MGTQAFGTVGNQVRDVRALNQLNNRIRDLGVDPLIVHDEPEEAAE